MVVGAANGVACVARAGLGDLQEMPFRQPGAHFRRTREAFGQMLENRAGADEVVCAQAVQQAGGPE